MITNATLLYIANFYYLIFYTLKSVYTSALFYSIASDVVASKLETAQIMGADVVIDSTKENLQDTGIMSR